MTRKQDLYPNQKKSLGQVFLQTDWPCIRIAEKMKQLGVKHVIEIGPGAGILTGALLKAGLKVTAVEKDDRFAEKLKAHLVIAGNESHIGNLGVVHADILKFNLPEWVAAHKHSGKLAVVGNIPYNISSPLVINLLQVLPDLAAIQLMTQLEFALRLNANPDSKDYGSLSVFLQLRANVEFDCKVDAACFNPVPKVDSAIITIRPRKDVPSEAVLKKAETVTRSAFTQRRKKLRNSVKSFMGDLDEAHCPIDLNRRADTLTPQEFVTLSEFLLTK